MNMSNISTNWKTTLTGIATIALGLAPLFGIHIPGANMEIGPAIIAGVGLIMAKDGNVTGGTTKQ